MPQALRLLFCLSLFAASWPAVAADGAVDFDRGVQVESVLKDAREAARENPDFSVAGRSTQLPKLAPVAEIKSIGASLKKVGALGVVYGPFPPRVINSLPPRDAAGLRGDARYGKLPGHMFDKFEAEWSDIGSVRSDLLSRAADLDRRDQQLFDDGEALNRRRDGLVSRRNALNRDIEQWNRDCADRPLPPDEYQRCLNRRSALQARKDQLDRDIATFNGHVEAWNDRSAALFESAQSFEAAVQAWEAVIRAWIERVKKALAGELEPPGDCTTDEHRSLQDDVVRQCRIPRSCDGVSDCELLRENLGKNLACLDARWTITNRCFRGRPNSGHQEQINLVEETIKECRRRIQRFCGGAGAFTIPAREVWP